MSSPTPLSVQDYIQTAYKKYYDSAFWMRDEGIMAERKDLLQASGVSTQEPLIEAVPQYPSVEEISKVCKEAGLSEKTSAALGKIVFGADESIKLRRHQAQALKTAVSQSDNGQTNVVVTSGTGSGKTESFLLPIIAKLLEERPSSQIDRQLDLGGKTSSPDTIKDGNRSDQRCPKLQCVP